MKTPKKPTRIWLATSPTPWRVVYAKDLACGYRVVDRNGRLVGGSRRNTRLAVWAVNTLAAQRIK